jgi:hypothetical protein
MNIATPPATPNTTAIHSHGSFQSIVILSRYSVRVFHCAGDDLAPAED